MSEARGGQFTYLFAVYEGEEDACFVKWRDVLKGGSRIGRDVRQSMRGHSPGASRTTLPVWPLFRRLQGMRDELRHLKHRFHVQGCG